MCLLLLLCPCGAGGGDRREGAGLEAAEHLQFARSPLSPPKAGKALPRAGEQEPKLKSRAHRSVLVHV